MAEKMLKMLVDNEDEHEAFKFDAGRSLESNGHAHAHRWPTLHKGRGAGG